MSVGKHLPKRILKSLGLFEPLKKQIETMSEHMIASLALYRHFRLAREVIVFNKMDRKFIKKTSRIRVMALWESDRKYLYLQQAAQRGKEFEVIFLPRLTLNRTFRRILKEYEAVKNPIGVSDFANPKYRLQRQRYLEVCKGNFRFLSRHFNVDAFLLPKIHDDWIIEVVTALKVLKIPFVISDRETVCTPRRLEVSPKLYRDHVGISVDSLCVANATHREFWLKAGIDAANIKDIGDVKSDYWFYPENWRALLDLSPDLRPDAYKILVFCFGPTTYRGFYYNNDSRDWSSMIEDFYDVLEKVLRKHGPNIQFVFKTGFRSLRDEAAPAKRFFDKAEKSADPHQVLHFNHKTDALELINVCDMVVGFQTTAVLESLFVTKPVVSIGWGPLFEETKDDLLPLYKNQDALFFADSPARLEHILEKCILERPSISDHKTKVARKMLIEKYFYRADGHVGERLLNEVKKLISL